MSKPLHTVAYTAGFLAQAKADGMSEAEMEAMEKFLAANPEAGDMIVGSGGCRKVRIAGKGKGKSGGYRVVTFFAHAAMPVYLIAMLAKGSRANFSAEEVAAMAAVTSASAPAPHLNRSFNLSDQHRMKTMKKNTNFNRIMNGLNEVAEIVEGRAQAARVHVPEEVDVKAIRTRLGLSQTAFAARFGFSAASVKDWEQRRRKPEASARILLTVIDREPEAVERALEYA